MNKEINTIKDLMNDKELASSIIEDLKDFDETETVTYEIWAIGYDEDGDITDSELFIDSFDNPDDAIKYARSLRFVDIADLDAETLAGFFDESKHVTYISIEVETVVEVPEEDYTENIGTIFTKELYK